MCREHTQKTPHLRHPWKDSTQEMGVETLELGCFAQRTGAQEPRQGEPAGRGASAETRGWRRGAQSRLARGQTLGSHTG